MKPAVFIALVLAASLGAPATAFADASTTTLESDLTPEIAADVIATYSKAVQATPGFDTFQALYTRFETVRKWEAFLDATKAAKLNDANGPSKTIGDAVSQLAAHGIDRASIATVAIEKLAALGDWQATDQAQAELVIDELGVLLGEISDPTQRIRGQLVLAGVELNTTAPQAARIRVNTALKDLRLVSDAATQLDFARKLSDIIFSLRDHQALEISSEIVEGLTTAANRATFTDETAPRVASLFDGRLNAATATDPLAAAWAYHEHRLSGDPTAAAAAADRLGDGIDPLPVALVLASGATPEQRRTICADLTHRLVGSSSAFRALNIRRTLLPGDCGPEVALALTVAFAQDRLDAVALPLADTVLKSLNQHDYTPAAVELSHFTAALEALGATDRLTSHRAGLKALLGPDRYAAIVSRAAIVSLLHNPKLKDAPPADRQSLLAGYAPARDMLAALTGTTPVEPTTSTPQPEDLALFREIGAALAERDTTRQRLAAFLDGNAALDERIAAAEGATSLQSFHAVDGDPFTNALLSLNSSAGDTPHAALSAALGTLDPAQLPAAGAQRDDLLLRLARHAAWSGDAAAADAFAAKATAPDGVRLDVAAITGVSGDFDGAVEVIRAAPAACDRVRAFRFLARARADRLDTENWLEPTPGASLPAAAPNGAAPDAASPLLTTASLTINAGHPAPALTAPPMPALDVASTNVTSRIPLPTGGAAGGVVGGEGRYVRLARFESPSFDGQQNNGVRDYVYGQNKTITPEFIFLNTGVFTVADVIEGIGRADIGAITLLPGGVVRFNRPIAIGPDATLILSGQEVREVQLNGTLGSYIVNAGHLYIVGTKVVGFDTVRNGPAFVERGKAGDKFRPFILSWSASETDIADSEFIAMGYSAGRSYGLSLTSGPADDFYARAQAAAPTGIVVNNSFDNSFYGFYAYEAERVQVVGNEYRNSIIYGIDPHDRSRYLNLSLNAAYGTFKKHGIIISREVDDSTIAGNLTFDNHGSGIMLDRSSTGTVIAANTVRNNEGDGISVFESPCTLIGANDISANHRSGVLVRNSWDVSVAGNQIADNKSAGVQGFISDLSVATGSEGRNFTEDPYQPFATVSIRNNTIAGNGAGIQTAGVSAADLYENHFRNQSKRLFGGDLNGLNSVLLQNSGKAPTLVTTNCRPVLTSRHQCVLTEVGSVLPSASAFAIAPGGDYCLGDAGSLQAQAFSGGAL